MCNLHNDTKNYARKYIFDHICGFWGLHFRFLFVTVTYYERKNEYMASSPCSAHDENLHIVKYLKIAARFSSYSFTY